MIPLTTRQVLILAELLNANGPLTCGELALRVGASPRMVRYDLRGVALWLQENGARLQNRPNVGALVEAPRQVRSDLWAQLASGAGAALVLSPRERVQALTLCLLTSDEPLSAQRLAREVGVAQPTALAGIQEAQRWLAGHGLELTRQPRLGFVVAGRELTRRAALVQCLIEAAGDAFWLPRCAAAPQPAQPGNPKAVVAGLLLARRFLARVDLAYARWLVDLMESYLQRQFADSSRVSLVLAMAVLMVRVGLGKTVEVTPEQLASVRRQKEFRAASNAIAAVEQRLGLALPEGETAYVAMHLLGAWTRKTLSDMMAGAQTAELSPEALEVTRRLLEEVSPYLLPCLAVDSLLVRNLATEVGTILNRLRFGLPMRNPLLEDVRRTYPHIFQAVQRARAVFRDVAQVDISEHEVADLAMHLAAALERLKGLPDARKKVLIVCGEGIATAWLLLSRVQVELPQLAVVEVASAASLSRQYVSSLGVAAIISTVPVGDQPVPVIVVSPLLPAEDIAAIRSALKLDTLHFQAPTPQPGPARYSLADLLGADTIALGVHASTWQQVVARSGELLVARGAVEPRYVLAMQRLIEEHGPYVVILPGVALLHAYPSDGAKATRMSLVTLREPVRFGHPHHDPVRVGVGLATTDKYAHYGALRQLLQLVGSPQALARVTGATTPQEILMLIAGVCRAGDRPLRTAPATSPSHR